MSVKISVVIITFNEQKNIERCLDSIKEVADEIIVLDSFSTDKTEEICKNYNVRFYKHKFEGHIQQKNRALEYAFNNWVLSLDADEELSTTLIENIKKIKQNPDADGYTFNRLTNYCGKWIKHSGWYPDKKLRLFDKSKGKWGGINPHDEIIMKNESTVKHIKGDLLHYSYYSIEQHIDQINKFTTIGAAEAFKKGKKSNLWIITTNSIWKFIRDYFIKLGFLDGYYGFVICSLSAWATFNKYLKLNELYKNHV
jgi:glycosyltransferase involved in cell wall biosynthesis